MPRYADYVNYLASSVISQEYSSHGMKKFFNDLKHYYWDDLFFYRRHLDQIICCCVSEEEQNNLLEHCHSFPYGGHFAANKTAKKVL